MKSEGALVENFSNHAWGIFHRAEIAAGDGKLLGPAFGTQIAPFYAEVLCGVSEKAAKGARRQGGTRYRAVSKFQMRFRRRVAGTDRFDGFGKSAGGIADVGNGSSNIRQKVVG